MGFLKVLLKSIFLPDMLQKKVLQNKKLDQKKLNEELKKFEGDFKKMDLTKSKEDNKISKNFFDNQKGKKIEIEFQSTNPKETKANPPSKKNNEVIIEEIIEEDKI